VNSFVTDGSVNEIIVFLGDPLVAMLNSALVAVYTSGLAREKTILSWTVMATIVGVVGLSGVLIIDSLL
jgi:H+/gluconate symporter-like permease